MTKYAQSIFFMTDSKQLILATVLLLSGSGNAIESLTTHTIHASNGTMTATDLDTIVDRFGAYVDAMASPMSSVSLRATPTCTEWLEQKGSELHDGNVMWLFGYLSGLSNALGKDFLVGTESDSLVLYVDKYCSTNPLKHLGYAANDLASELITQKRL
jgi:hypothetical protein